MTVRRWKLDQGSLGQTSGPVAKVVIGAGAGCRAGLIDVTLAPGAAMPEHDHAASEVMLIVRAGHALLTAVADGAVTELDPGVVVVIPVGERVRLENVGDSQARLLVVLTPPDFASVVETWSERS